MDVVELQRARVCFLDLIVVRTVLIPDDVHVRPENEKFEKFVTDQERGRALMMYFQQPNQIEIVGISKIVEKAEGECERFFESMRRKKTIFTTHLSADICKFLEKHFNEMLKIVEEELSKLNVSVNLEKNDSGDLQYSMTGIEENFPVCRDLLNNLCKKITQKEQKFVLPGLKKFFNKECCQKELEKIQQDRKVYVKAVAPSTWPDTNDPRDATPESFLHNREQSCYDRYEFTTNEGVKLFCKHGRIENEKVNYV